MTYRYYISDLIFFDYDKKTFFIEEDNEITQITNKNYKTAFNTYGWDDLDILWNIELGDQYLILDCGSHGDCLFHCLSEALNLNNIYKSCNKDNITLFEIGDLRNKAANQINESNFDLILQSYKIEKEVGEFQGDWNPDLIETVEQLQNELKVIGDNFWGDHIIIQLLSKALKKNIVILNSDDAIDSISYNVVKTEGSKGYIIIYYENNCHYKLVGKFSGKKLNIIFNSIPKDIIESHTY